jgi:hypothetical protein
MYPNAAELSSQERTLAQEIQQDANIGRQVAGGNFPKFVVEKWLSDIKGKRRNREKLANAVITVIYGLYGYGWREEEATSSKGTTYKRVVEIARTDGLRRLDAGEDPLIPGIESQSPDTDEVQNDNLDLFGDLPF